MDDMDRRTGFDPILDCYNPQKFQNVIRRSFLFRPLLRGEELYNQLGFFVQSILADRYIHRRELRLLSLESLSSVEYGIKKIFLFSFLTRRYRGSNFRENRVNSVDFIHLFSEIWTKISPILIKFK